MQSAPTDHGRAGDRRAGRAQVRRQTGADGANFGKRALIWSSLCRSGELLDKKEEVINNPDGSRTIITTYEVKEGNVTKKIREVSSHPNDPFITDCLSHR